MFTSESNKLHSKKKDISTKADRIAHVNSTIRAIKLESYFTLLSTKTGNMKERKILKKKAVNSENHEGSGI